MPVRNGGDFLRTSVDSILEQNHKNLELLLVDDHSDDGALSELPQDPRIRHLKNIGCGLIDALNTGLNAAAYDYIARMDADDVAHPDRLKVQLDFLNANPEISICGCLVEMIAEDGIAEGYKLYEEWINNLVRHTDIEREFFIESPIAHPSAMFYKQKIKDLGAYLDRGWPEDYDLWCRALLAGYKFGKPSGKALLQWRDYSERTSRLNDRYHKKAFIACKANSLVDYLQQKNIKRAKIWGTGPTGLMLHDEMCKRAFEITGFIDINPKMRGRAKRDKEVLVLEFNSLRKVPNAIKKPLASEIVLVAVSSRGAREKIRAYLTKLGWIEGVSFIFAA